MTTTVTETDKRAETPTPNVELLRATLRRIIRHPEEWDQNHYRCESAGCFAFHAAMIHYDEAPPWSNPDSVYDDELVADGADDRQYVDAGLIPLSFRAQRILGLTEPQRIRLFDGDNDLDDLREIVAELCSDGGLDPTFRPGGAS